MGGGLRRSGTWYCVKVFLAVRIGISILGWLAVAVIPARDLISVPGWAASSYTPGPHNLITAFQAQDALWFLRIASDGYASSDGSAAFFPLYPLTVRAVSTIIGHHPLAAALLVSNLAFLGALIMLYRLTASEFSETTARRAVLYTSLFPTSFFFFAPYSESLFLLMAVTSFWGARKGKWWLAGIAGAGAALTRSIGIVIALALLAEALHQKRQGKPGLAPKVAWSLTPVVGTLAYLGWWGSQGNWRAPLEFQSNWDRHPAFPLKTLVDATHDAWVNGSYWLLDWLVVALVVSLAIYGLFKLRPTYSVYMWAGIVLPLCLIYESRPLMSMPRFAAVLFPLYWLLAKLSEERKIPHDLIVGVGAAGLALMAMLFVNAWFVF
ncbi:MAG: hypothetical protein MUP92_04020 [Actinobacteria bacterium]|nr:hypothetical protein [Actinomycetota bacterium]